MSEAEPIVPQQDESSPEPNFPPIISGKGGEDLNEVCIFVEDSLEPSSVNNKLPNDLFPPAFWFKRGSREDLLARESVPIIDIDDDNVFSDDKENIESKDDKKLVDWATNVYVPACKDLLYHCSQEPVSSVKVQTYLRLLGNTITFFCNEHQSPVYGISPSRSMTGLSGSSRETTPPFGLTLSPPTHQPIAKQESETSVAMKVLRSVSSSLIPPLLSEANMGFSKDLYRKIVVAIQKISWKVEACLSYGIPNKEFNIHQEIFDDSQILKVGFMMIALPPEEPKLQNSPAHVSKRIINPAPSPLRFNHSLPRLEGNILPFEGVRRTPSASPAHECDDDYFRPKAPRRTTVSISKLQVQNLGLNMVDITTLDSLPQTRSSSVAISSATMVTPDDGLLNLQAIRDRVLRKLAKEFPQLKNETNDDEESLPPVDDEEPLSLADTKVEGKLSTPISSPLPPYPSPNVVISGRYSCEPSLSELYEDDVPANTTRLRERTKSLEFDKVCETPSPTRTSFDQRITASRMSEPPDKGRSTLPSKRRGTIMKIIQKGKKARSFGRGDMKTKHRTPVHSRNKSASEFFSVDRERVSGDVSSIEVFSRGALPSESSGRDSVYLNIEVLGKTNQSPRRRKFSVSGGKVHRSSLVIEINVSTNLPEFEQQEYTINRYFKDITTLYDILVTTTTTATDLPERPEKRSREWKQQVENFLQFIAKSQNLRNIPEFMEFLKPGDISAISISKDSEFDLLMTFYTPLSYESGEPGSHLQVEHIKDTATPLAITPSRLPRWNYPSLSAGKGSVFIERQEGEEETTFIIREEEKDALIITEDQSRFLIVAGTFEKLVEQLACEEKPDPHYISTFLLGYRHFSSSVDLISLLVKRFQMTVAPDASEEEFAYAEKWRYVIQLRVLDILTYWIKSYFPDFLLCTDALDRLKGFIATLNQSDDSNFTSAASALSSIITDKLNTYSRIQEAVNSDTSRFSTSSSSPSLSPVHLAIPTQSSTIRNEKVDINSFSAIQLARQLTLMELDFLKVIEIYELALYTWESGEKSKLYQKNLDAYIARFNKVSYWAATEILSLEDEKARALLIEKFIDMAKHCQELRNFNTAVSLVTGLSLSSIRRLHKTWKHVNERLVKSFTKLRQLVNPANNHNDYRKALASVSRRDGCIPYFGVFMRDITLCNYGNPKKLRNGLCNFSKLRILVQMFEEIYQYQRSKYYYPSDDRTRNYCAQLSVLDEHELYDLSLRLEPREQSVDSTD